MKLLQFFVLLIFALGYLNGAVWNCTREEAAKQFKKKISTTEFPTYVQDPYKNQTEQSMKEINEVIGDENLVCAIQYEDEQKQFYHIKQFSSANEAVQSGYIVSHQGRCGSCSNLKDLSVYLERNLTAPVRWCGIKGFMDPYVNIQCLLDLGFTYPCAQIWYDNTVNTKENCKWICVYALLTNMPYVIDGELNPCLQCDEDKSGPIFKYYAGRTRRNSGIKSEIDRPSDQIYNISQCYY